jgi:hypothetical protein
LFLPVVKFPNKTKVATAFLDQSRLPSSSDLICTSLPIDPSHEAAAAHRTKHLWREAEV